MKSNQHFPVSVHYSGEGDLPMVGHGLHAVVHPQQLLDALAQEQGWLLFAQVE